MLRIKSAQEFFAGILFICFGAFAFYFARGYTFGSVTNMGPGFLPTILAAIVSLLGAAISLRGLTLSGETIARGQARPQFFILIAVILFGLLIERTGLAPTVFIATLIAAMASPEIHWKEAIALALGAAVFSVVLFIGLLNQPIVAWTWRF